MAYNAAHNLTMYSSFFKGFKEGVELLETSISRSDLVPTRWDGFKINAEEIPGAVVNWSLDYLRQKKCPSALIAPITKVVMNEVLEMCRKDPTTWGFNADTKLYDQVKLMKMVFIYVNRVCLRYLDNSQLENLLNFVSVTHVPIHSIYCIKNERRTMEDRYAAIEDLNTTFGLENEYPASYYAVFDGHVGQAAASYSASHLHQHLIESIYYPNNIERALRDAFAKTDEAILEKAKRENNKSGTTAVCALWQPTLQKLYVAWVGDSLACMASHRTAHALVKAHKPDRTDERLRVENMGGVVCNRAGVLRVCGQLAMTRAFGNPTYKPYISSNPDIICVTLTGEEDFIVLATDGLWDAVTDREVVNMVYDVVLNDPGEIESISRVLTTKAQSQLSSDNISVIVVFLRTPREITLSCDRESTSVQHNPGGVKKPVCHILDNMDVIETAPLEANTNGAQNPFMMPQKQETNLDNLFPSNDFLSQNGENNVHLVDVHQNGNEFFAQEKQNGDRIDESHFIEKSDIERHIEVVDNKDGDDELDFAVSSRADDSTLSPSIFAARAINEGLIHPLTSDSCDSSSKIVDSENDDEEDLVLDHTEFKVPTTNENEHDNERPRGVDLFDLHGRDDETPTPPINEICENAENLAESGGEESDEDEWNYIQGDKNTLSKTYQEHIEKAQLHLDIQSQSEDDDMETSPLNPEAKEFVPVSPTHENNILNDIIAQSPKNPQPISEPRGLDDFLSEIGNRPNEHENFSEQEILNSNQKDLERMLNGRNDEVSNNLQPRNLINDLDNCSTKAEYGGDDDTTNMTLSSTIPIDLSIAQMNGSPIEIAKQFVDDDEEDVIRVGSGETDQMTASFYQERDDDNSTNPFNAEILPATNGVPYDDDGFVDDNKLSPDMKVDLNVVHKLPDDLDEFLSTSGACTTNTASCDQDEAKNIDLDFEDELHKVNSENVGDEKEQESPIGDHFESNEQMLHAFVEDVKQPTPDNDAFLIDDHIPATDDQCNLSDYPKIAESTVDSPDEVENAINVAQFYGDLKSEVNVAKEVLFDEPINATENFENSHVRDEISEQSEIVQVGGYEQEREGHFNQEIEDKFEHKNNFGQFDDDFGVKKTESVNLDNGVDSNNAFFDYQLRAEFSAPPQFDAVPKYEEKQQDTLENEQNENIIDANDDENPDVITTDLSEEPELHEEKPTMDFETCPLEPEVILLEPTTQTPVESIQTPGLNELEKYQQSNEFEKYQQSNEFEKYEQSNEFEKYEQSNEFEKYEQSNEFESQISNLTENFDNVAISHAITGEKIQHDISEYPILDVAPQSNVELEQNQIAPEIHSNHFVEALDKTDEDNGVIDVTTSEFEYMVDVHVNAEAEENHGLSESILAVGAPVHDSLSPIKDTCEEMQQIAEEQKPVDDTYESSTIAAAALGVAGISAAAAVVVSTVSKDSDKPIVHDVVPKAKSLTAKPAVPAKTTTKKPSVTGAVTKTAASKPTAAKPAPPRPLTAAKAPTTTARSPITRPKTATAASPSTTTTKLTASKPLASTTTAKSPLTKPKTTVGASAPKAPVPRTTLSTRPTAPKLTNGIGAAGKSTTSAAKAPVATKSATGTATTRTTTTVKRTTTSAPTSARPSSTLTSKTTSATTKPITARPTTLKTTSTITHGSAITKSPITKSPIAAPRTTSSRPAPAKPAAGAFAVKSRVTPTTTDKPKTTSTLRSTVTSRVGSAVTQKKTDVKVSPTTTKPPPISRKTASSATTAKKPVSGVKAVTKMTTITTTQTIAKDLIANEQVQQQAITMTHMNGDADNLHLLASNSTIDPIVSQTTDYTSSDAYLNSNDML